MKIWGQVKPNSVTTTWFVLTDGSDDGIKVQCLGSPGVSDGQFVVVRGAAGPGSLRVVYRE